VGMLLWPKSRRKRIVIVCSLLLGFAISGAVIVNLLLDPNTDTALTDQQVQKIDQINELLKADISSMGSDEKSNHYLILGRLYAEYGDLSKAKSNVQTALAAKATVEANLELARVQTLLGEKSEALLNYKKALTLLQSESPNNTDQITDLKQTITDLETRQGQSGQVPNPETKANEKDASQGGDQG
jgi:tetratricopeptide (TPR) repeat protein